MRPGVLLPYAALGILIAVVSSAAVLSSTGGGLPVPAAEPTSSPQAATQRPVPELSRTGRIAYLRDGRLWISGLDGSLRRSVAPLDDPGRAGHMRWSPDGDKIAFVDAGLSLVVIHVDGQRWDVSLPVVLRDQGWRIADVRWSPDSIRIAATFLRPGDGRADAFVTDLTPALAAWIRVTEMNDLFVGDWVSDTEILASTAGGVIALVEVPQCPACVALDPVATRVRPLTGALGTSPVLASDGRVHFLAGRVPSARDPSVPHITASRASVWSAALNGSDVRRETIRELNDVRLDGRLPDGRYLVHRGGASIQSVAGDGIEPLPANAGLIHRVRLAPDGRTVYGFTRERIVQLDVTKVGLAPPAAGDPSATVFLDTSGAADVWFPQEPWEAAPAGQPAAAEPAARYAFALGGHIWRMGTAARPELLRAGQAIRRTFLPVPRWSPAGTHLLALEQAGFGAPITALIAVVVDRDGEQIRLAETYAAARSFAWAPDGDEFAVVVDRRGVNGTASNAQLEVRFLDTSGGRTREAVAGTEVAWTSAGILVLDEADGEAVLRTVSQDGTARTLAKRDEIVQRAIGENALWLAESWGGLDARLDGSWTSVHIGNAGGSAEWLVLMDAGGTPVEAVASEELSDAIWSPTKPLLGYTLDARTADERAVVHDPGNGPLSVQDGRFAGWSPDGDWYYVARTTGLFALPLAGGEPVRVGPVGAPAAITTAD
ncbi:MAG: hypothetical protein ACRDGT_09240 [Candidatus Limnocylindria bacterium]